MEGRECFPQKKLENFIGRRVVDVEEEGVVASSGMQLWLMPRDMHLAQGRLPSHPLCAVWHVWHAL